MPELAKWLNSDLRVTFRLSKGFTVPQVAQKHDWTTHGMGTGVVSAMQKKKILGVVSRYVMILR